MRKYLKLSAVAMLSTALTVFPAHALSLNLGGNGPLVDLGNGNNADATVSVDTGNLLGGNTGSGGSGTDANAIIDLNLGSIGGDGDGGLLGGNALIDLGGDNDNGALIDLDGDLLDLGGESGGLLGLGNGGDILNLGGEGGLLDLGGDGDLIDLAGLGLGDGPLLDLSGNTDADALVEIDIADAGGVLDLGSTGGIGGTGNLLDLGGNGNLLDLVDGDLLDLGDGSENLVAVNLLGGAGLLPDTDVAATVGGDSLATVTITTGGDGGGGTGGGGGAGGNGGNGGGAGGNGNNGGNGGNGGGSPGTGGDMAGNNGGSLAANANACLTLDSAQLDELVRRHTYNRATFNSWASAQSLKIVEVDLCDAKISEVAAIVGASANVARLQAFLAAQAKVRAGLQSKGFAPGDVIAADHNGEVLTVYVI